MNRELWQGRPYYSLDAWCKQKYHEKVYKISLNAGLTCPNRDGTLDTRGCIFCSAGGSGDFAVPLSPNGNRAGTLYGRDLDSVSMQEQIAAGLSLFREKKTGNKFIAYFQAYTNTYGPVNYLNRIYRQALEHPDIVGISIATRPDCLGKDILALLTSLVKDYPDKEIWLELGLQTIHETTAAYIRRGYKLSCFEAACKELSALGIPVIVHVILGLPGETREMLLETISYLNGQPIWGVKLQLLHVLRHTDLAEDYAAHKFDILSKEDYLSLVTDCLTHLSPDIVIHRLTGDGPKDLLIAPLWSGNKRDVLNSLHRYLKERVSYQGMHFN